VQKSPGKQPGPDLMAESCVDTKWNVRSSYIDLVADTSIELPASVIQHSNDALIDRWGVAFHALDFDPHERIARCRPDLAQCTETGTNLLAWYRFQ
jgi:hypothetical protein